MPKFKWRTLPNWNTKKKRRESTEETCLQAALAGAGRLHVGLVTFLLADSALHQDAALRLARIHMNVGGAIELVATSRRGRRGDGLVLVVDGGPERRLREQPAGHQREMVCHSRAAWEHAGVESAQSCGHHATAGDRARW